MPVSPRLVLVRHGQTEWNTQQRWQGATDIPLNENGRRQARSAAPFYASLEPVAIWSSPLSRAHDTATEVAALTGLRIRTDDRLKEMDFGAAEGCVWEEVLALDPGIAGWRAGQDVLWPGGESGSLVQQRVGGALRQIDASAPAGLVLVFSHGTAIRMGAAAMLGWGVEGAWRLGSVDNCCSTGLLPTSSGWRLDHFNASPQWGSDAGPVLT
ncbi:histidine phosphatase family protein [Propionibacterium australiense]|uniref:Histidine phosphatase family protein n=1 Tax=Propionibacterium australiense TaxID=119981 RepID=A0A383S465_9ACTN|nr:histidine phosphatase family protein [Propionibacterium australiense]RLP11462.1 histidine phosphatase family protein [Propionibacterium australiense]RLP12801.1 histidine phosphatase family protein [Propionibacterium australiense]SYZ32159.1 Phosphoglycerate mutase family phosphohistidine signature [Propionibacterium australiense]VEH90780.1 Phosphoglyceromutase [Propionibacterium australiense]